MDPSQFPPIVNQLAAAVGGVALAWRETDATIVIVMVDGRKLTFKKADPAKPRNSLTLADFNEHFGQAPQPRKLTKGKKGD